MLAETVWKVLEPVLKGTEKAERTEKTERTKEKSSSS
jgi:hypothetical protein